MAFGELTVIDIATLGAAPQIAAFFGDLGARVIKVEPPGGDPLRNLVDASGTALQWRIVNRHKQCVTLDLTKPAGCELLHRMLGRADLLVCALSGERLRRWALDESALRARHPRLVAVNLTTYGTSGPWAERPGSGTLAEAVGGLAALTGPAEGPPTLSPVGLGDYLGVMQGIIAALVGLYGRDATSDTQGRSFDVAMYEPILAMLSQRIASTARDGVEPGRHGNRFPTMAPRNTYRTIEGDWVALTAGTDAMVRRMFELFGQPELADDARFRTNRDRVVNVDALDSIIQAWIGARSRDEVVAAFVGAGVSVAAVDGVQRVIDNPHFRARGDIVGADADPTIVGVSGWGRSRSTGWIGLPERRVGADNAVVYGDWLGLAADQLESLVRTGVI